MKRKKFKMRSEVWLYPGPPAGGGSWHFISVPKKLSAEIKKNFGAVAKGWGSLPVTVTIGRTSWKTSIFPDKRSESYLLPLKKDVRKAEGIFKGDNISFAIEIRR